jgi:hypothetical protein
MCLKFGVQTRQTITSRYEHAGTTFRLSPGSPFVTGFSLILNFLYIAAFPEHQSFDYRKIGSERPNDLGYACQQFLSYLQWDGT